MNPSINTLIGQQFGAAIDMLENALKACPDAVWNGESKFWYIGYHTLFFMDYYLSDSPMEKDYTPPAPFTTSEFEDNVMPERVYDKEELLAFLRMGRQRCYDLLTNLTTEDLLTKRFVSEYKDFCLFELVLYNMRHVQHHTAQLNMLLRQGTNEAPPNWVSRAQYPMFMGLQKPDF